MKTQEFLLTVMNATNHQQKIIRSAASARLIVRAGPGTGKTFSLIERIKYLVKAEKLEPATEMLVLSFSVSAVREIRNRLQNAVEEQGYDDELLFVTIRTFDSFASSFLYALDTDIALDHLDYDRRIELAAQTVTEREDAGKRLGRYRHIMVDEVQDLTGVRAALTLAVLDASGGGFTLFGDPAQAVYNFLMEEESGLTSDEFLEQVCSRHDGITDYSLSNNFRVGENTSLKAIADTGRKHLLGSTSKEAYNFLRRTFADLPCLGSLNDVVVPEHLRTGTTAFLCRTNGQILRLARHFADQGVDFSIRRPLEESDIPAWVGRLFSCWKSQSIRKKDFTAAMVGLEDSSNPDSKQAWKELQTVTGARSRIRITQLRKALTEDGIFSTTTASENENAAIISTVHRAKGREFQDVVLVISEETSPDQFLDEGRVMFVGLSRACRSLYRMSEKGAAGIRKIGDRWLRSNTSSGKRNMTGIEVGLRGDIDIHSPVSLALFDDDPEDIGDNQEFLSESVRLGSPARLELYMGKRGVPIYKIWISAGEEELVTGLTSAGFGHSLKKIIAEVQQARPSSFPGVIDKLWVRDVVTEVGNLGNADVLREYRNSGLWLGVRLQGLGTCKEWRRLP